MGPILGGAKPSFHMHLTAHGQKWGHNGKQGTSEKFCDTEGSPKIFVAHREVIKIFVAYKEFTHLSFHRQKVVFSSLFIKR